MSWLELPGLIKLGFQNLFYNWRLGWKERRELGRELWYRRLVLARSSAYLGVNPFRMVRRQGRSLELCPEDLIYGETPIHTAFLLLQKIGCSAEDRICDLGCGRGTYNFVGALAFGCRGYGSDVIEGFIRRNRALAKSLSLEEQLEFEVGDVREGQLVLGTIYCLAPTTYNEQSWEEICRRMSQAEQGSRAICLSRELPELAWETNEVVEMPFSWGVNRVFLMTRI